MKIIFSDKTELQVENFVYDQMSNYIFVYVLTSDFNSLVPKFKSEELLNEITVEDGKTRKKYTGYINTEHFFAIVQDEEILATIVLKQEQYVNDN